jgi:hypothetical protein
MFPQVQGLGLIVCELRHADLTVIYAYVISRALCKTLPEKVESDRGAE